MSWNYQSDPPGNILPLLYSPPSFVNDEKMSQLDPLDILNRAPSFSEFSQNSTLESDAHEETRTCDYGPPRKERMLRRKEFVIDFSNKRCRMLFVYGEKFLGKAYFAKQIIKDLQYYHFDTRLPVHCLGMTSFESLMTAFGSSLGMATSYTDVIVLEKLRELTSGSLNSKLILLITNFEDIASKNEILTRFSIFLNDMFTACHNVSVIVTSRVKVNLLNEDFCSTYKLDPPSEAECCRLLKPILPFCKTYEPIFLIVRRCFYRPAFILRVCHIILEHHVILTPEDISEMLRTTKGAFELLTRFPSPGGSITEAIRCQLSRLPAELKSDIRMLCYLDGTFGMVEATQMLQRKTVTDFKIMTLLPLKEQAILDIDLCTQQIRIDPLIRQFILNSSKHLQDNDPHKRFIVDYLGNILSFVRLDISVRTKGRALGFAQDDFYYLERTLTKAVHTFGEESYWLYMKFVKLVEGSMSAVCPEKAVPFYKAMVEASAKFGTKRDQAFLQGLYAIMIIEIQGDALEPAIDMITNCLRDISDNDYIRVVLMRRVGWMHIRLGNNEEARRQLTIAKRLSYRIPDAMEAKVEPHRIHIDSHLAIVNVFLGKFPEAESLLVSTIPRAKKIMPDHPILAVMLQTMGLKLEREGLIDEAIISYKAFGCERRKLKSTLPTYLVTNLTNLASIYLWRGQTDKAFPLLESALNIRRKLSWWGYNTALVLWYRGNAYLFSRRPDEAERSLKQAFEILIRVTPRHSSIVNIRVSLAHAHMVQGRHNEAQEQFQQALYQTSSFQQNINDDSLLSALEHLLLMKNRADDIGDIYRRLIEEAERLSNVSKESDAAKYVLMQRKLTDWRMYLGITLRGNRTRSERGSAQCNGDVYVDMSTGMNWNILFTCEHCKMLN